MTETGPGWGAHPNDLEGWPLHLLKSRYDAAHHGDFGRWAAAIAQLPDLEVTGVALASTVSIAAQADAETLQRLRAALADLHPWRKGPFRIAGVHIDSEWRSDWKWDRLASALTPLAGRRVLDIGCGNGYFGWRLLEAGAREVVGVDPTLLFCMQHLAIQRYARDARNWVLPLKVEELPPTGDFDAVLSMGVVYHRRDPKAHVQHLVDLATPGGQVVLESIVVTDVEPFSPAAAASGRYARMRNVWYIPSPADLVEWLRAAGAVDAEVVDVTPTSAAEQRSTEWMRFESFADGLDRDDATRTVEGYPAPVRAIVVANKP